MIRFRSNACDPAVFLDPEPPNQDRVRNDMTR
jgi:hypothetical protein